MDSLADRIRFRLEQLGKTERKASLEAGLSDSFLRNIRERKSLSPRIDTLEKIAHVLQTTAHWLISGEGQADLTGQQQHLVQNAFANKMVGNISAANHDNRVSEVANATIVSGVQFGHHRLPVFGQAVGGIDGDFPMNGTVLFDVLCPPQLDNIQNAYAIMVSGDSMYPRYEDGELAFVDPTRRVKKGDYVVAQIIVDEAVPPHAFIKKFVRHNAQELILEQFNPRKELSFSHTQVVSVHFIALAGVAA